MGGGGGATVVEPARLAGALRSFQLENTFDVAKQAALRPQVRRGPSTVLHRSTLFYVCWTHIFLSRTLLARPRVSFFPRIDWDRGLGDLSEAKSEAARQDPQLTCYAD